LSKAIVNYQHHQPMSRHWGGGTLSSSDGQRFPVSRKVRNATALPRYFGYGRGVTFYTRTSDQFSQCGTKVIPATVRDATYVFDEILDNETELPILEHTTETAGYTEILFALFDLLGLQFSPRIRDLGDQQLYRLDRSPRYRNLEPRLKGPIRRDRILRRSHDVLRFAGSLKRGWVAASLRTLVPSIATLDASGTTWAVKSQVSGAKSAIWELPKPSGVPSVWIVERGRRLYCHCSSGNKGPVAFAG
jgi:TnpA family transposase